MTKVQAALTSFVVGLFLFLSIVFTAESVGRSSNILTLSDKNTLTLNMAIDADSAKDVQLKLMELSRKLSNNDSIYLVLNSPGGSIDAGFKIIETAKGLKQKVHTVSIFSASMSFIISQYLDTRFVLDSSVLMSHRGYASGLEGQVPGSLNTRVNRLTADLEKVNLRVAKRAKMSAEAYRALIADELWMDGPEALQFGFADQQVHVFCDKTLQGPGDVTHVSFMGIPITVTWDKCPLITAPRSVEFGAYLPTQEQHWVKEMLTNRIPFPKKAF